MTIAVTEGCGPEGTAPEKSSGIRVIIVGCGYGGIAAAIECHRKGHEVVVFEKNQEVGGLGDTLAISQNGALPIYRWDGGNVHKKAKSIICNYTHHNILTSKGEFLLSHPMKGYSDGSGYTARRGDMMAVMFEYFQKLGIELHTNADVREYFETEESAGVVVNGKHWTADAVLCADGVHSKGRHFVLGRPDLPRSSGYAIYRAWFASERPLREDPVTAWLTAPGNDDTVMNFIGPNAHTLIATVKHNTGITWALTHEDKYDIEESWTQPGSLEDVLKVVEGWDPRIAQVYKATPRDQIFDHKLLYRDPLPTWTSPKGRVLLLGDAAHSYVPTSGQGATQAIEDAATVAITLELAGRNQVPLALRTVEKMRYERASIGQEMGIETREHWLKTNWEQVKKNPEILAQPRPDWLFSHDPQGYAYEEFEVAAHAVLTGCPYQARNVPGKGTNHRGTDFEGERLAD
ncbi:hypothetical protein VSDG_04893 [Cytospora chrysosperma]|uniref:FAD-binding domain-containing protein n=1 Tax=Cytospora chrysosperma TaxID=252740 RepID=A0A423W3E9_CYTCH|nr:hypothetical protein VSDG_04893 [Valsa sordida]